MALLFGIYMKKVKMMESKPADFYENRIVNAKNPFQGNYKKVLCVCSAGLLRSPTAALVLSQDPYNYNTRSVGTSSSYALVPIDPVHIYWADEIVCMTLEQQSALVDWCERNGFKDKSIKCLNIPDSFEYRDPKLIELIKKNYVVES